jgi:hypothetical protein
MRVPLVSRYFRVILTVAATFEELTVFVCAKKELTACRRDRGELLL